ncbi:MAG: hypothetical protein JRH20_07195 [Deltaproteobacteria bacterium]|nr:hypothetical protein [Deltaproteobacteria bacterium]
MRYRRYDIMLRFVPSQWAAAMTVKKLKKLWEGEKRAEVEVLVKELDANLKAAIKIAGNRASMAYGDHKSVRFLKEEGAWKIEDPD